MKFLEAKALREKGENKSMAGPPENKFQADPLDGVAFASSTARALAREAGWTAADFAELEPDTNSGFTAAYVRRLIEGPKE